MDPSLYTEITYLSLPSHALGPSRTYWGSSRQKEPGTLRIAIFRWILGHTRNTGIQESAKYPTE